MAWTGVLKRVEAEIAPDDFAKPGEIAPARGALAMLDQPELALFWGGSRGRGLWWRRCPRNFEHHEDEGGDGKHGEKHGDQTLAEEQ